MMSWHRLVRDYEQRIDVSRQMIYVAMGGLLLKGYSTKINLRTGYKLDFGPFYVSLFLKPGANANP
jgi:hypothetical protein